MKLRRPQTAFTLIELLVVISIIGILSALVAPSLSNFRKGDAMASATSQLLGGVARARQLAISQRTEVYMVFLPTNFWTSITPAQFTAMSPRDRFAITNLADKQLTGYTFVSFRTVGDQPGQRTIHYLTSWQALPDGVFIPEEKFNLRTATPNYTIYDPAASRSFNIYGFNTCQVPFPTETSALKLQLPCVAFDYQGKLFPAPASNEDGENIPLAHGSISYGKNRQTGAPQLAQLTVDDVVEKPLGNSTNFYNIVHIDWLTGRGHLERKEVQ